MISLLVDFCCVCLDEDDDSDGSHQQWKMIAAAADFVVPPAHDAFQGDADVQDHPSSLQSTSFVEIAVKVAPSVCGYLSCKLMTMPLLLVMQQSLI